MRKPFRTEPTLSFSSSCLFAHNRFAQKKNPRRWSNWKKGSHIAPLPLGGEGGVEFLCLYFGNLAKETTILLLLPNSLLDRVPEIPREENVFIFSLCGQRPMTKARQTRRRSEIDNSRDGKIGFWERVHSCSSLAHCRQRSRRRGGGNSFLFPLSSARRERQGRSKEFDNKN